MKLSNMSITAIICLIIVSMITGFFPVLIALAIGCVIGYIRPSIKIDTDRTKDFLDNYDDK